MTLDEGIKFLENAIVDGKFKPSMLMVNDVTVKTKTNGSVANIVCTTPSLYNFDAKGFHEMLLDVKTKLAYSRETPKERARNTRTQDRNIVLRGRKKMTNAEKFIEWKKRRRSKQMSEILKPCPFCGGRAELGDTTNYIRKKFYVVDCPNCGVMGRMFEEKEVAIQMWNKRTQTADKILPIPCTKVEGKTVKDWFQKINEELDELKEAVIPCLSAGMEDSYALDDADSEDKEIIAEEAADTITAITSMLEAMGIDEEMRQAAQQRVNEKNKERGRY